MGGTKIDAPLLAPYSRSIWQLLVLNIPLTLHEPGFGASSDLQRGSRRMRNMGDETYLLKLPGAHGGDQRHEEGKEKLDVQHAHVTQGFALFNSASVARGSRGSVMITHAFPVVRKPLETAPPWERSIPKQRARTRGHYP